MDSAGTTRYVYDGLTIIAETDQYNNIQTYHLTGVGFVKTSPSPQQFYYRENGLGSNVATLDSSGATVSKTEYDAYGIEEDFAPGTNSSFRFGRIAAILLV